MSSKGLLSVLPSNEGIFTLNINILKERINYLIDNDLDYLKDNKINNIVTMTSKNFKLIQKRKNL